MFQAIRRRMHASPATAIASLALVLAMTGGAYAAGRYVITSTKQISPKVLKALQGKTGAAGQSGANGAQGTQGAAGPQGPAGPAGGAGKEGPQGPQGNTGAAGTSVKSQESETEIGTCKEGGSEFKAAGNTTYACNGEKGKEGSPWTAGGTLPPNQSLKGYWGGSGYGEAEVPETGFGSVLATVSYSLPVKPLLGGGNYSTHYIKENESLPAGCSGGATNPIAAPGNLCVFVTTEVNVSSGEYKAQIGQSGEDGFMVVGYTAGKGRIQLGGTWAVAAAE